MREQSYSLGSHLRRGKEGREERKERKGGFVTRASVCPLRKHWQ